MDAGQEGLWKLGIRSNRLALDWKFMSDLEEKSLGVNQVEMVSWNRVVTHEEKKVKLKIIPKKGR